MATWLDLHGGDCALPTIAVFEVRAGIARLTTVPFDARHAEIASQANARCGSGNEQGVPLNPLDLMVYAVARERGEPLLCTGKDFVATDLTLHAASRPFWAGREADRVPRQTVVSLTGEFVRFLQEP